MNNINYFLDCSSIEQIKKKFKQLALKNHLDCGGDPEIMKEINRQYHEALRRGDGQTYRGDDEKEHIYKYYDELEEELANKMLELIALRMPNVEIYLIGLWLWITGDSKPHKDKLKALGCFWHPKRECWHFKSKLIKSRASKGSLEDLAAKYGIENVQNFKRHENRKPIKNGLVKASRGGRA